MKKRENPQHFGFILNQFLAYISELFSIESDTDQKGTIDAIVRAVEFRGVAIWTLIFAVYIASIGLNTNSTAVIIGAMLISPLMGPIMGAGLSLGIYDFDLLRKSIKNLSVMTLLGISTSTLYFLISPLSGVQSELLARTNPTVYDVLIAIFGGATGIIAGSRKDKISNAIPGVAIATALMPPLCTAGFGIANGNYRYFAGAFYLYMINSVFIGITTLAIVRYLKFKRKVYLDPVMEKKIQRIIFVFSILFIMPSLYMAYDVIVESRFKQNAHQYVTDNFNFEKSKVLSINYGRGADGRVLEVTMIGEPLSDDVISHLKSMLSVYDLVGSELRIIQTSSLGERTADEIHSADSMMLEKSKSKDERITYLEHELSVARSKERLIEAAVREVNILFPAVGSISFGDLVIRNVQDLSSVKEVTVLIKWKTPASQADRKRLELFLKSRLEIEKLTVLEVK
jgi:uncharacterized hydrophobic protein (TIGR00271 family)